MHPINYYAKVAIRSMKIPDNLFRRAFTFVLVATQIAAPEGNGCLHNTGTANDHYSQHYNNFPLAKS